MERDAPPSPADVVPPVAWESARKAGFAGLALTAVAAGLGLVVTAMGDDAPWPLATARLLLVLAGSVTAGFAVSLRPDLWKAWALGSAVALVAWGGTPAHWDSFRLLFLVLAGAAAVGAGMVVLPRGWRYGLISAWILFHFGGIFMATTTPPPTPWITEQLYNRVYNPYLQFAYLRNAYHFYSPEPGPASMLFCLVATYKLEPGETLASIVQMDPATRRKRVERVEWVVLPKRPNDIRDPLGLTYFRRLSITEGVSRSIPDYMLPETFEKSEMREMRKATTFSSADPQIPIHPTEPTVLQYRLPSPEIMRYVLPSYGQHLILEHTPEDDDVRRRTTIKVYRVEHRILSVNEFVKGADPYHPTSYKPYFVGEFDVYGRLVNPRDPMLYWLVPVIARTGGPAPGDPKKKDYDDYLSVHAGSEFDWSQLR